MFNKAIVRTPGNSVMDGITSQEMGKPDYELALRQHKEYIEALELSGVKVHKLGAEEVFPDSCFVEDVAVVVGEDAIVTRPGASTRQHEIERIKSLIEETFNDVGYITAPATLEGGDVMLVGNTFYVGRSKRTNAEGAKQFSAFVTRKGFKCVTVPFEGFLHLKTGMTPINEEVLLVTETMNRLDYFEGYKKIVVDANEEYAVNIIANGNYVIMPKGYPKTKKVLASYFTTILEVSMSEFEKIDGGLTCLSLRYND